MRRRTKWIAAGGVAVALVGGGAGMARAGGGAGGDDAPITGNALDRAGAAALAHTGGGRVTGTEVGDEESLYEVEVTRTDGSRVDVQLDSRFTVVGQKADTESPDDDGPGG